MSPSSDPVKPRRRYDASRRREAARRNRIKVLKVARQRFLHDGYARASVAAIATDAGVSAETIYKTFGGKPGLVRAVHDAALAGIGAVSAPDRSDQMSADETDPVAILRNWATLTTEVAPLAAPSLLLVRSAAATDPDMAALLHELSQQRRDRMMHNARRLARRGGLRSGLTLPRIRDILYTFSAPELYEVLVLQQRWSRSQYGDFVHRGLVAQLVDRSVD
jgi:AcrR family transcriptional regulator